MQACNLWRVHDMYEVNDNLLKYITDNPQRKIMIYGAGNNGKRCLKYIGKADYFVDLKARELINIDGVQCLTPDESYGIQGQKLLILSVSDSKIKQAVRTLYESKRDFEIFEFARTPEFSRYEYTYVGNRKLKINIVYSEDGWIFGKFAKNLKRQLILLGHECTISTDEDPTADINHYIAFGALPSVYEGTNTKRTTMITHVDNALKLNWIKMQSECGVVGICMSKDTLIKLQRWGVSPDTICYINPAHDGEIRPRKINLGITNRCYGKRDFRKRDDLILQVMKRVDKDAFKITIMGADWEEIVHDLEELGVEIEYYADFDRDVYMEFMPKLDYWLYYGFDEGAMGYLDALAAGVNTIVTPQGYHLDTIPGPTYTCSTIGDFVDVLNGIADRKKKISGSVKEWTWENYTKKHLEIWRYMTRTASLKELFSRRNEYMDGIYSLLISNDELK